MGKIQSFETNLIVKMALLKRFLLLVTLVVVAVIVQKIRSFSNTVPRPQLDEAEYWGPGKAQNYKEDISIKPFKINVGKEVIDDLLQQLRRPLKYQTPLDNVNFEYGFNNNVAKNVIAYWRDSYLPKWNERQQFLNQFPQYKTQIQGLNIHYIHVKPTKTAGKKVLPLLLLHGWPGSVREFYELIPLLTTPNPKSDYVFEVVVPSLVGYGFSDPATKTGFGHIQMAVVMRNLMLRVGHEQFFIQGGDWGSIIGSDIATLFPNNVLGYHTNLCTVGFTSPLVLFAQTFPQWFSKKEHMPFFKPISQYFTGTLEESGYFHIQATKPDTIGFALLNNPAGLAIYILEKFSTWTNANFKHLPDGGLTQRYTWEALFDNLMLYYVTDSIVTSQRLYSEAFTFKQMDYKIDHVETLVPTGAARFLHDLAHNSDYVLKTKYKNLVHSTYHFDGGHFAALELPNVLYEDFIEFVPKALNTIPK